MDMNTPTGTSPTTGTRGFANGPTADEVRLAEGGKRVLQEHLLALYRAPLPILPQLVKMDKARMGQRILSLYNDSSILNPLRQSLTRYVTSGITLGGQVGLADLGLSGTFTLTNAGIRANVDRYVNSMVATDGDRSVTRTTANEMAAFIARQMEEIEAQEEEEEDLNLGILLGLPLAAFITGRAGTRAFTISAHEGVAATRYGMVAAYVGNGLPYLVYVLNRRLDPAQNCGCDQHDGKVYSSSDIPPDARIPRHIGCNCSYMPYFPGWTKPTTIWTGQ